MAKPSATIHLQDFADDHGVTIRTVTNWLAEGMPYRTHRGERRVVRKEANVWLLERTKAKAREKAQVVQWDKDREMAMKIRIERQMREIDLAKKQGSVLGVEEFDVLADRLIGGFSAVVSGQLQAFEREMGLEPAAARALVLEMQVALMRGAQQLADTLDAEAEEIARIAAEADDNQGAADDQASPDDLEDNDVALEVVGA